MSDDVAGQAAVEHSAGAMLRAGREALGLPVEEITDRMNWMPKYVGLVESDDFQSLSNPAFARGYVKAYGKLLGLDEAALLSAFDRDRAQAGRTRRRHGGVGPAQVQSTGVGVAVSVVLLVLLVAALWWWQGRDKGESAATVGQVSSLKMH